MGDNDELGSAVFDELGNVVETIFDVEGLGSHGLLTLGGGISTQSGLLFGTRLRAVLGEELEKLGGYSKTNLIFSMTR